MAKLSSRCRARAPSFANGLALAETLVSLTLLTLLLVSVLNFFPSSMATVGRTRTMMLARTAAQNRVEALAARPFSELVIGHKQDEEVTLGDGQTIKLQTTISAVSGHSSDRLKQLRCQAEWSGRTGPRQATQELYVHAIRR